MAQKPSGERLILCFKPRAAIVLFESQHALTKDAPLIERYSTARGIVFEKHTEPSGRVLWYRVKQ